MMQNRFGAVVLGVALLSGVPAARADVWDVGADADNDSGSDNELVNGLSQVHDMAAQQGGTVMDEDWFPLPYACNNSYEILIDGITGALGNAATGSPALELRDSDAVTVLATSQPVSSVGIARRITYSCFTDFQTIGYVRVSQPDCGLLCVDTDQYRIHFRNTTALVPRFNNSATQVSILVLQNSTNAAVLAHLGGYDLTGTWIGSLPLNLGPTQVATVNLSVGFPGMSGALKIVNDAPYGALAGKVVSVEPATGFTFDTPLTYQRPE
jgi:hypothetical protein